MKKNFRTGYITPSIIIGVYPNFITKKSIKCKTNTETEYRKYDDRLYLLYLLKNLRNVMDRWSDLRRYSLWDDRYYYHHIRCTWIEEPIFVDFSLL